MSYIRSFYIFLLISVSTSSYAGYDNHTTVTRDVTTTHIAHYPVSINRPRWNEFLQYATSKYGLSLGAGVATGVATGAGCSITNKYMPWFISWIIWITIRNKAIDSIEADLKQFNIPHSAALLSNSAWAADWLAYLSMSPYPSNTWLLLSVLCK